MFSAYGWILHESGPYPNIARRQNAREKVQADIKDEQHDELLRSQQLPTLEQQSSTEQTKTQKPQEET